MERDYIFKCTRCGSQFRVTASMAGEGIPNQAQVQSAMINVESDHPTLDGVRITTVDVKREALSACTSSPHGSLMHNLSVPVMVR